MLTFSILIKSNELQNLCHLRYFRLFGVIKTVGNNGDYSNADKLIIIMNHTIDVEEP